MLSVITALQVTLSMRLDDEVADGFTMNVLRSLGQHAGMWARTCALKGASENRCIGPCVYACPWTCEGKLLSRVSTRGR